MLKDKKGESSLIKKWVKLFMDSISFHFLIVIDDQNVMQRSIGYYKFCKFFSVLLIFVNDVSLNWESIIYKLPLISLNF
jgi:hypothetical protein